MKKYISLIKACMSSDMSLFKIKAKNNSSRSNKLILPIFITLCFMMAVWTYGNILMDSLMEVHMDFVFIPLSVFLFAILLLAEGIYKSGSLLFNCKDDNLLLSLPISRKTVLFVRVFKFYVFEFLYHSLFLLPILVIYIRYNGASLSFIITSIVMLLLLPIIPIVISCIFGTISSGLASRFKFKKAAQTIITMILLVGVMYVSFNLKGVMKDLANNAKTINDFVMAIYYPAGVYSKLCTDFNIVDLLIFILVNVGLLSLTIFLMSRVYFKINSRLKKIEVKKKTSSSKDYKITRRSINSSLIHKEFGRFFKTPVFIINAGFGLVLFIIICIVVAINMDALLGVIAGGEEPLISSKTILDNMPIFILVLILMGSLTTSITSSMISLEGKSFTILKSLPVPPRKIIMAKVYTSAIIMIPALLIGDIILFIRFGTGIVEALILIATSIVLPMVSGLIGIIINLKYPKMDAVNDTEVVKQSTSSMISVFAGFGLFGLSGLVIYGLFKLQLAALFILLIALAFFTLIFGLLYLYLSKNGVKDFNNITV